jgi:hypothetical protein
LSIKTRKNIEKGDDDATKKTKNMQRKKNKYIPIRRHTPI